MYKRPNWKAAVLVMIAALLVSACQKTDQSKQSKAGETPAKAPSGDQQPEFFTSSLAVVPGRNISRSFGFVCRLFPYNGQGDYIERLQNTLDGLEAQGKKKGANGFINMHISAVGYEVQGSKWASSMVNLCGDFVILN